MNKEELVLKKLIEILEMELKELQEVAQHSKEDATNSEMKQDGKYDTRKIEASYLAGAQERRVHEVEQELNFLKTLKIPEHGSTIEVGMLFKLEHEGKVHTHAIYPCAGGHHLDINGEEIIVLSHVSPVGEEALGLDLGDTFEVELANREIEYRILPLNN